MTELPDGKLFVLQNRDAGSEVGVAVLVTNETGTGTTTVFNSLTVSRAISNNVAAIDILRRSRALKVSPDNKKLVFTGGRKGETGHYRNLWAVDVETKVETAITQPGTLDDGPEYTPDGKYIYFNSVRTGTMQIWRMRPDGSQQEQITFDEYNDWFPHISPDGKWLVYIAFPREMDPWTHPFYQQCYLRLMPTAGGVPKTIAYLYGGQGSINTPSWSPDSKRIAFVSNSKL